MDMDMKFLELLSNIRNPVLTWINLTITIMGESTFFISALCLLYWCVNKKEAYRIGIVYVVSGLAIQSAKIICRVPRPWHRSSSFEAVSSAKRTATGYSFPSGHTQSATALFSSLAYTCKSMYAKVLYFIVIFAVMLSRMYLGVHTPSDVAASFIITMVISFAINYYTVNYSIHPSSAKYLIAALAALILIAVGICSYVYFAVPEVITGNIRDAVKASGAAAGFLAGACIEKKYIKFNECAASLPMQFAKYFIGLFMTILLNLVMSRLIKVYFSGVLPLYFISKMIVIMFIICVYPVFIKKFFSNKL